MALLALLEQARGVDHGEDLLLLVADHHLEVLSACGWQGVQLEVFIALERITGGSIQQRSQGLFEALESHGVVPAAVSVAMAPCRRQGLLPPRPGRPTVKAEELQRAPLPRLPDPRR